jgi:uncharacterized NAD(P)/FAD-binding protein YdhS
MSIKLVDTPDIARRVAVVGGGASGTLAAAQLLRSGSESVVIVEHGARLGRGVAYGTQFAGHLLNVPAASMSGLPDDPEHFLRWARARVDAAVAPTTFLPRRAYGAYLEDLLDESEALAPPGALRRVLGDVVDVVSRADDWELRLADGSCLRAGRVVLATGNQAPGPPALRQGRWPEDPTRFVADPWRDGALSARAPGPVLLVGTGLTMVDVALQLHAEEPSVELLALSRGGLLPHAHRAGGAAPSHGVPVPDPGPSLVALLRFLRSAAVVAEVGGGDWRDAVNALRPVTAEIWAALPRSEQRRFVDRLARFWDVHRHRLAPEIAEALHGLRSSGCLTVAGGRIRAVRTLPDAVELVVADGTGQERTLRAACVVNCTGPAGDARRSPLLAALCAAGTARPHALGLGLDTADGGAVVDARGRTSESLFALGPLRRGELWESTAVPEIRMQAEALARRLTRLAPAVASA